MSSNDLILLNQLLEQRKSEIAPEISDSDFFELFAAEQIMKDDDLSYEDLTNGLVDGGNDGGIDSIYFFINGVLFNDDLNLKDIKRGATLRLAIIQSKISESFKEESINKLIASAADLFDLGKDLESLKSVYNSDVLKKINEFHNTVKTLTSRFPILQFNYVYATKATQLHPNVSRKTDALKTLIESKFQPVEFRFDFYDASTLLLQARRNPSRTSTLRLTENPISTGEEGFVCLVSLQEYKTFITSEDGKLRTYLFEGNVRDYQGKTEVNKEIKGTLESPGKEDFWWLNNGVSIICSRASLSGKNLTIDDVEIVNGLQTSHEIFNSLNGKDLTNEKRSILIRILKPDDQASRDRIIKATNSQTPIPPSSLRATDKIHRDIEDYCFAHGYYYDRRKNYYKNSGKPIKRILSIPFVAQSVMACALLEPANARSRSTGLLKNTNDYRRIFNPDYPLSSFLICPLVVMHIEHEIQKRDEYKNHLNNLRFHSSMLYVLRFSNSPSPSMERISNLDISQIAAHDMTSILDEVFQIYQKLGGTDQVAKSSDFGKEIISTHKKEWLKKATTNNSQIS